MAACRTRRGAISSESIALAICPVARTGLLVVASVRLQPLRWRLWLDTRRAMQQAVQRVLRQLLGRTVDLSFIQFAAWDWSKPKRLA